MTQDTQRKFETRADGGSGASSAARPYVVGFLLPPEFVLISYAAALEPLRAANTLSGKTLYMWTRISLDGAPVQALCGGQFEADAAVGDDIAPDMLLVCCPVNAFHFRDARTFSWLRRIARKGTVMGGISGGVLVLARAGLLEGYKCTFAWPRIDAFRTEFPNLDVSESLFVVDRGRVTCGGGYSSGDLMHALIKAQHGHELADAVSEWFLQTHVRAEHDPQRMSLRYRLAISNPVVIDAIAHMEKNLERPLSTEELAARSGTSVRQLQRLFKSHVRLSVGAFYRDLRLELAQRLLQATTNTVTEAAMAAGFYNLAHFSHAFRVKFGYTPSAARRRVA